MRGRLGTLTHMGIQVLVEGMGDMEREEGMGEDMGMEGGCLILGYLCGL